MKDKIKEYWPYFAVVLAIILPWFFHSGYLFFTDMVWGPNINLDWLNSGFLASLLIKLFSFVFSVAFLEKLYIGLIIFIVLFGGKKIADYFVKDKLVVFVVSLFALFNPFVYDRLLYGQTGIVLAFGFFLLSIAYLFQYLDSREGKKMILFGVFVALTLQIAVHFIFFSGLFFLFFLVLYFKKWKLDDWKHFARNLLIAGVICILLNINWLAADMFGKTGTYSFVDSGITRQDLLAFKTSGSSDSQVLGNVVMMSGFWGKDQYRYADLTTVKENWGRSFLLLLPVILLGAIWGIRKKETRFLSIGFLIIFLVSAVLASGVALSFGRPLSYWLFERIPFYKGLRESQKWVSVVVLIYTAFLSAGLAFLLKTKIISIHKNLFLVFLGAIIIMQAPFLLWGFWGQARPVQYPVDWIGVNKSLECSNDEKILFLPWHLYMSFNWVGKIIANPARAFFTCSTISSSAMEWGGIYDNSQNDDSQKVYAWLGTKGNNDFLESNKLGIKYILLAKELDWQNYLWIGNYPNIKLLEETESLLVYKVHPVK